MAEDEALISMMVQAALSEAGCEPLAALDLVTALNHAKQERLDCAYLDLNLSGEEIYPVADLLRQRQIPYVIATGYGRDRMSANYRHAPLLLKPFTAWELVGGRSSAKRLHRRRRRAIVYLNSRRISFKP